MGEAVVEEQGDGELELASVREGGGGVLGVWGGELARERGDWNAGVLLVLKRTREGELGLFLELATVAARSSGTMRGRPRRAEGGLRPSLGGERRRSAPAVEKAERERGGR